MDNREKAASNENAEKVEVKTQILDQEYTIRGQAEPEYIFKLSKYVDQQIRETRRNNKRLPRNKVLVLTALNIADELFQAAEEIERLQRSIERLKSLQRRSGQESEKADKE